MELVRRLYGRVLGVPTMLYLPWRFFNIASPLLTLLLGYTGFRSSDSE